MTADVVGGWTKLHNEVHNLSSPNINKMMRWAGHVARMEEMNTEFWSENLKGRDR
jgi:hypothetical protein